MLIEELLVSIPEESYINDAPAPWVPGLVDAVNTALSSYTENPMVLGDTSTGKDLRKAIRSLPARIQVGILNDNIVSYGNRKRRKIDKVEEEKAELEVMEKKLRYRLIKYGVIVFGILSVAFVTAVVAISWKQNTAPNAEIASGLFNTVVEILKLIFTMH